MRDIIFVLLKCRLVVRGTLTLVPISFYYLLHIDHVLTISSIFLFLLFSSLAKLSIFIHKIQLENLNSFRGFLSKGPIPDPRPQSP